MKKILNQKLIGLAEYYELINANFFLSPKPINRIFLNSNETFAFEGTKLEKLNKLKIKISNIKNCDLKKNGKNMVFSDGNINSKIMLKTWFFSMEISIQK